uniref:Tail protein n=2 Tax=viral metagenome TaxID=1070528 RepID=A0A6M3M8A2_9ZZZZ
MPTDTGITGWTEEMQQEFVRLIDGLSSMRGFRTGLTAYFEYLLEAITTGQVPIVVANNTGGDLLAGVPIYIASSDAGGLPELGLADADVSGRPCQLILAEDIPTGGSGLAYGVGVIIGVNTAAWAEDTKLFVSETAGTLTSTAPTNADARSQEVAVVELQATAALGGRIRVYPELTSQQVVGTSELQDGILTAAAAGRAKMADGYFVNAVVAKFADGLFAADDASRAKFVASFLGNTAIGRALMESGFFNAATALDKFAANSMDNTFTDSAFAADAFAADAGSRAKFADLIWPWLKMDALMRARSAQVAMDTSVAVPTAAAGRGMVVGTVGELLVEAQGVADLTVQIAIGGDCYSHQGRGNTVAAVVALAGFTIPAGAGEERNDIVVVAADGTVTRRVGAEGAPAQPDAVLTAGDVPLARVTLTQGVDIAIQAGNVVDLRERGGVAGAKLIDASVLTAALEDDCLAAGAVGRAKMATDFFNAATALDKFGADSLDNPFCDAAFIANAFAADADSRAIFQDGIWTPAKLQASLIADAFTLPALGAWGATVDGVETGGGGMCGASPTLTNAAQAYCKVYDIGSTTYSDLALSSALAGWAANWQLTADAASEEVGDASYFGDDNQFCEIGLDLAGALATWGADGGVWEYWNGAAYVAIPAGTFYDNMDTTAQLTGLRSFQQSGAFTFMPPADWAANDVDGQTAFWIRYRITALQVTQTPITNAEEHSVVTPLDGFQSPWNGIIDTIHLVDNAAVLHTTADVLFFLMNHTAHTSSTTLTFAQDTRCDVWAGEALTVTEGDILSVHCVQQDGAAEPTGVMLTCHGTRT